MKLERIVANPQLCALLIDAGICDYVMNSESAVKHCYYGEESWITEIFPSNPNWIPAWTKEELDVMIDSNSLTPSK